jgi:methyltransferase (TIGR00027 family)
MLDFPWKSILKLYVRFDRGYEMAASTSKIVANQTSPIHDVTDTAFWVANHRAVETQRSDALFNDPLAQVLAADKGSKIVAAMKATARYSYWNIVIRTVVIDRIILDYVSKGGRNIINVGAGLDTRPYRLPLPLDLNWFELDFTNIINFKNAKLAQYSPQCKLHRLAVDLSKDSERAATFATLNEQVDSALILTEGVVPYLTEDQVAALAHDLKHQPNFSQWISEYYAPKAYPRFQGEAFKKKLGSAQFKFFPPDILAFYAATGWKVQNEYYLYDEGLKVNRPFPLPWWGKLIVKVFGEKGAIENMRVSAYVLMVR